MSSINHGFRAAERGRFRAHPLDGALLHFHPDTGTCVRIEDASTASLRRQAPRVVMFGVTNKCNLQCSFCSRDGSRPSRWTVETASALLRGLSAAGMLEVAFGGGEPLAFRGFSELISDLHAATPLALNVTTNGMAPYGVHGCSLVQCPFAGSEENVVVDDQCEINHTSTGPGQEILLLTCAVSRTAHSRLDRAA